MLSMLRRLHDYTCAANLLSQQSSSQCLCASLRGGEGLANLETCLYRCVSNAQPMLMSVMNAMLHFRAGPRPAPSPCVIQYDVGLDW